MMSAVLTPLPSPSAGLAARVVTPPQWKPLPFVPFAENVPQLTVLPVWPALSSSLAPASTGFQGSHLTSLPSPSHIEVAASRETPPSSPPAEAPQAYQATPPFPEQTAADFTDDDLREAFGPIMEEAVRKAVYAKENGIDTYLEPMLRATIRRALAEYSPASRPFQGPRTLDRLFWRIQALFTSRTYEEILFEKTHRSQVDEVFLIDVASLALISFASCDPARHSSAKRISSTVQRLAMQVRDEEGKIRDSFDLPDQRTAIARAGRYVVLVAVVRGIPNEMVLSDLEFSLRRIEDRFREQFQVDGSPLLHALQPFLEDCLLIQSPASAA